MYLINVLDFVFHAPITDMHVGRCRCTPYHSISKSLSRYLEICMNNVISMSRFTYSHFIYIFNFTLGVKFDSHKVGLFKKIKFLIGLLEMNGDTI